MRLCSLCLQVSIFAQLLSTPPPLSPARFRAKHARLDKHVETLQADASLADNNDIQRAMGAFPENKKNIAIIAKAGRSRDWKTARAAFQSTNPKGVVTYNAILTTARRCGRFKDARIIFSEMCDVGVAKSPITYNVMVDMLGKCGRYKEAWDLWNNYQASGVFPRDSRTLLIAYTALATATSNSGLTDVVNRTLVLLKEVEEAGVQPDLQLYTTVLSACKVVRDAETARSLFEELRWRDIKLTSVTYSTLLGAHTGQPLNVLQTLVSEMQADGIAMDEYVLEEYLLAILGTGLLRSSTDVDVKSMITSQLQQVEDARFQAIVSLVQHAKNTGIRLTRLVRWVEDRI